MMARSVSWTLLVKSAGAWFETVESPFVMAVSPFAMDG
jgi:hypothetical protein